MRSSHVELREILMRLRDDVADDGFESRVVQAVEI